MTPVHLRIPPEELAALDAAAEAQGRTRAGQLRWYVRRGLKQDAPLPPQPCSCHPDAPARPDCSVHGVKG